MTYEPDPTLEWASRVLLRVEVGSTAHGTGTTEHEDYDELGVMTIPWQQSIGVPVRSEREETIVYRPDKAVGERSGPGDYDLTIHSARKFCRLAASGNPSVLMVLFGPLRFCLPDSPAADLRSDDMIQAFWHQGARARFLGYCRAQRERLEGVRGGKHTNRPELIEQHGFDTKYAMHMLRLGFQGLEYMTTGRITLPMRDHEREFLQAVRAGEVPLESCIAKSESLEDALKMVSSRAPAEPDWDIINDWLADVFEWGWSPPKPCVPIACPPWEEVEINLTTNHRPAPGQFTREAAEFYARDEDDLSSSYVRRKEQELLDKMRSPDA